MTNYIGKVGLLNSLENMASRPGMYVQPVSFLTFRSYFHGLAAGLALAGIEYTWDEYFAAAQLRGWDPRGSIGIERDFSEKKLSDEEMVMELIAIETDAYRRALGRLAQ